MWADGAPSAPSGSGVFAVSCRCSSLALAACAFLGGDYGNVEIDDVVE